MSRGIYIVANDKVTEQAIALLKSLRLHDPDTPVVLIPYDENSQQVTQALAPYQVQPYADLPFIQELSRKLYQIFGEKFFANPNKHRKHACWFGPFDEFLYIDTDIVVFEKIIDNLSYLADYDFLCCDYQHKGGIKNTLTPKVLEDGVFTAADLQDIFNSGFWASKKNLFTEAELYETFAECAAHPDYFDFSEKTTDQPIFNYLVLKRIARRFNLVRRPGGAPGNWGGSPHFRRQGDILFDPQANQPLQFLHWAGIRIAPGCPYWDIWEHYRYLNEAKPEQPVLTPKPSPNLFQRAMDKLKRGLP